MKVKSESEVAQSCPTLSNPMDYIAYQAPQSMGFSRQEYWSGMPLPSPEPPGKPCNRPRRNRYCHPCLQKRRMRFREISSARKGHAQQSLWDSSPGPSAVHDFCFLTEYETTREKRKLEVSYTPETEIELSMTSKKNFHIHLAPLPEYMSTKASLNKT